MSGFFIGTEVKQFKKGHSNNLELFENSEFVVRWILGSELWFLSYIYFPWLMESCLEDRVEVVYEAQQVLRMHLKY